MKELFREEHLNLLLKRLSLRLRISLVQIVLMEITEKPTYFPREGVKMGKVDLFQLPEALEWGLLYHH